MKTRTSLLGRILCVGFFSLTTLIACKNHSEDYGKVAEDGSHSGELEQQTTTEPGSSNSAPGISPDSSAAGSRDANLNSGEPAGTPSSSKTPQDPAGTAGEGGTQPR